MIDSPDFTRPANAGISPMAARHLMAAVVGRPFFKVQVVVLVKSGVSTYSMEQEHLVLFYRPTNPFLEFLNVC